MVYLVKVLIFGVFFIAVKFAVDFFLNILNNYMSSFGADALMCQFGVYDAMNMFFSIIITSYLFNQVLSFWK